MRKTWTINNGWNKLNMHGQIILVQIGPMDFDPDYDLNMEYAARGVPLPYRCNGTSYTFSRKRDFDAAVAELEKNGFIG